MWKVLGGYTCLQISWVHAAYENRLKNLNIDFSANRTRLKGKLFYFHDNGIQKQSDGNNFS